MKTTRLILITLTLFVLKLASAASDAKFDYLVSPYFETQMALASDSFENARLAVTKLAMNAKALAQEDTGISKLEELRSVAGEVAFAKDIVEAREKFASLSNLMIGIAGSSEGRSNFNIVEMRCSMAFGNAGGSWLQNGNQALNPYFGASMLRCGSAVQWLSEGQEFVAQQPPSSAGGCCSPSKQEAKDECCDSSFEK